MKQYVVLGMRSPDPSTAEKYAVSIWPTIPRAMAWVQAGNVPHEFPFYAVAEVEGDYYVVVSKTHTVEQLEDMAMRGDNPPFIFSGPHSQDNAEISCVVAQKLGWIARVCFLEVDLAKRTLRAPKT